MPEFSYLMGKKEQVRKGDGSGGGDFGKCKTRGGKKNNTSGDSVSGQTRRSGQVGGTNMETCRLRIDEGRDGEKVAGRRVKHFQKTSILNWGAKTWVSDRILKAEVGNPPGGQS